MSGGIDTTSEKLRRRYFSIDAAGTLSKFMVDGLPDGAAFSEIMIHALVRAKSAAESPRPQVVAFGDMVALLWEQGNISGAIELERLWNDLAHTNSFSLLCAYPTSNFLGKDATSQLSKICDEHSDVIGSSNSG